MKKRLLASVILLGLLPPATAATSRPLQLFANQPAARWDFAYPVGNGTMGGMSFGAFPDERIVLNHDTILEQLRTQVNENLFNRCGGPFQIDGNLGTPAGIAEMLLQSQVGEIELLPALPAAWPSGKVTGLRARGGLTVDIEWQDGKVTSYRLAAKEARSVKLRVNGEEKTVQAERESRR